MDVRLSAAGPELGGHPGGLEPSGATQGHDNGRMRLTPGLLRARLCAGLAAVLVVGMLHAQTTPASAPATGGGGAAPSALARELMLIEQLPDVEDSGRVQRLLVTKAPAGSLEALERLYLLATSEGAQPPALAEWLAWQDAAGPSWASLGGLARSLAELQRMLNADRYREAAVLARSLPALQGHWPAAWRARALLAQATAIEETGDPEAALLLRLQATPLLESLGAPWRVARALGALAFTYGRLGQHDRAMATAQEGLRIAEQTGDLALQASQHNIVAAAHSRAGRFEASRIEGERALDKARRASDPRLLALLLANLSDSYLNRGDPGRAFKLADEAYPIALKLNAVGVLILAQHNRGMALIQMGRVAKGRDEIRRAVTMELQGGGTVYAAEGLQDLGRALERAGDLAGAYQAFTEERDLREDQTRKDRRQALAEAQSRFDSAQREQAAERLRQQTALQAETIRAQKLRYGLVALALACGVAVLALVWLLSKRLMHTNRQLAQTNLDLAAQSEVDPLTGLGNRRRFRRLLQAHGSPVVLQGGVLLLDIDHFKQLNDTHGHAAGDTVLTAVAGRLKRVVPNAEGLMRWGGEEFLVVIPGAEAAHTTALARQLLEALAGEPVSLRDGRSLRVTVSIGALTVPIGSLNLHGEQAVDLADALMYRAKSHGRNQAWSLEAAQMTSMEGLLTALAEVDNACAGGTLVLHRCAGPGGTP